MAGVNHIYLPVFQDLVATCCTSTASVGQFFSPSPQDTDCCICPHNERVLRGYTRGEATLPAMTPEQREWCLEEIGSVEGYDRAEHVEDSDSDLASTVLCAWTDYCRDKGMI